MDVAPFDVVIVPFPYSDRLAEKRRPAVVVSSAALHADRELLWVAMVTTTPPRSAFDFTLSELDSTGLNVACGLRPGKLAAIEPGRIVRRVGALGPADRSNLAAALDQLAGWRTTSQV
jgi:mRNA interferase MazF